MPGFRKYVRKQTKRAGRYLKKRYFKGRGYSRPKIGRMVKDIAMVKDMVNAEKEFFTQKVIAQDVDFDTPYAVAIANIPGGTNHGERNGESVKLHGYRWNIRVQQQTSVSNRLDYKIWFVKFIGPRGTVPSIGTFLRQDFDGNYSTQSLREEDWFGSWQIIKSVKGTVIPDSVSGQTGYSTRNVYGRFKGKTHQRYSGTLGTTLLTDQMYIIMVVSGGNTATSTALKLDYELTMSFYDN